MSKNVTVTSLIKKKEKLKNKTNKQVKLFVPSLDGEITVKAPDKALILEALEIADKDNTVDPNEYLVLECCVEPNLKDPKLLAEFGYDTPLQLISSGDIFDQGEIISIADFLSELAGLNSKVTLVDNVKN
ncbi:phage tail assembly chaperone [Paenibacillus sp. NPDC093718]|uniref:phage tail assembly chaperone n=1 Tax=Paenibacillus sp. NPDC093718 TaxID=3390601 RepID=UPI003D0359D8